MKKVPYLLVSPAVLFYIVFLMTPLFIAFLMSFHGYSIYTGISDDYSLVNYKEVLTDSYFYKIFLRTFLMSIAVAVICTILAIVEALIFYRMSTFYKSISLLIILGPLLVSVVVRTLGWAILIGENGIISTLPVMLGFSDEPMSLMYTQIGVVITMVHVLVPFSIIAIMASMTKLDDSIVNASLSLKASSFYTLRKVLIPQLMPGILSGIMVVFTLSITAFATPAIIGGRKLKVIAMVIYDEFLATLNWPLGASIAIILIIVNFVCIYFYNRYIQKKYKKIFQ
jgi:putative spermidine/putrescine transport system permease protein